VQEALGGGIKTWKPCAARSYLGGKFAEGRKIKIRLMRGCRNALAKIGGGDGGSVSGMGGANATKTKPARSWIKSLGEVHLGSLGVKVHDRPTNSARKV